MDYLWTPWRYSYVTREQPQEGCIFCVLPAEEQDEKNHILYRGRHNFVILNLYPYTSGHMMVAPYAHLPTLEESSSDILAEMMALTQRAEQVLRTVYKAQGINLGMNIGECAGAGVTGHIHMHVLPRWSGDSNFMTVVGETRVAIETVDISYERLVGAF